MYKIDFNVQRPGAAALPAGTLQLVFIPSGTQFRQQVDAAFERVKCTPAQQHFAGLNGEAGECQVTYTAPSHGILRVVKVPQGKGFSPDYFRNYLAGFTASLRKEPVGRVALCLPSAASCGGTFASFEELAASALEGVLYGAYAFTKYKTGTKKEKKLTVTLLTAEVAGARRALARTKVVMEGVAFARDLQNEPGSTLTPAELARRVKSTLTRAGAAVTVFNEKEIARRRMGGVLAVGRGSVNPPRFIVIRYKPSAARKKIALVGKGVTFDTGGISLKPASDMWEMKGDMSGAAVVAGTILAAVKAKLPVEIVGIIPSVENKPSGSAFMPGDIVTTASGKTIEVDNTDAEGRVILSDALHFASAEKPDAIIDLATLTGACVVALGEFVAGLFTKNDPLARQLYQSGQKTWDRLWRMPMWDDYHQLNKSDVADVKNLGGRWGGAITAAKFLENWVDGTIPWAHLDIAGPSMPHAANSYSRPYLTGFGVRLLFHYLANSAG